jgi:hypothetical protein
MKSVLSTLFLASSALGALNKTAGIHAALDILVLEQAKDVYFDSLVAFINNLTIPDVTDDKGNYFTGNSFVLNERTDDVLIYTDVPNNAIVMHCNKMSGVFYNDAFRYKEWPFVATGHSEVIINTILVQFGLSFGTTDLPDGRRLPYITGVDIKTNVDRFDINIKIWGNIWSDIASLFEVFFVGTVADLIEQAIIWGTGTEIPAIANAWIQKTDGYFPIPIYPYWTLDWETDKRVEVTDTYFEVGVKGLFFDKQLGETEPTAPIPVMPVYDTSRPEKFQAYVSAYSVDSFLSSWSEVGSIDFWFNATEVPANATANLTTTTLNILMPGIADAYGEGLPCDVKFHILNFGNIEITADNQEIFTNVDLTMQFYVETATGLEYAAEVTLTNANFGYTLVIDNMQIMIALDEIKSTDVKIDYCSWGTFSTIIFKTKLNLVFQTFKVWINQKLAGRSLTFPSNIMGIFELSNLNVIYYNDYLYCGATPTFIGTASQAFALHHYLTEDPENLQPL